ncbi:MAG: UDP-glucose 4-epimerase GalE [Eubacteriales bacterium]|nr:UDP-glucose 4-epimerase GalE [Eubacteriales bacterium]
MKVLVTGGAGYIGSHAVRQLVRSGHEPVVFDNLLKGHRQAVGGAAFFEGDLLDKACLKSFFKTYTVEAVIHFAACSLVGESMQKPDLYYENNVVGSLNLFKAAMDAGVDKFIFSSTAAVYGEPDTVPITEGCEKVPLNVYGKTKLVIETMLGDFSAAYGIRYKALRYFNAAGADEDGDIGEDHTPETHLIPIILQYVNGKRDKLCVFGDDYPTRDGTCVRDYIHVTDLADAHVLALRCLADGGESGAYNLGSEQGFTVLEIIGAAEKAVGQKISYEIAERRPGDPATLIASSEKIREELRWEPQYGIDEILSGAWRFHSRYPDGYR